ncbi:MAG: prephenate dehydratase [Phycisphaerales bacterium]|nr:prephenate dehydratase [Phycisphaerales bacterium]
MSLDELRQRIDELDHRLIAVLNERAKLVVDVGRLKRSDGTPIYAPHREQAVLKRALGHNEGGPLLDRTVEAIYREIMSGSFALERPLRIGFLGPQGSFSHVASRKQFGSSVTFEDLHEIDGVFTEVQRGHVDYGLVPIENSLHGGVRETMDAFRARAGIVHVYAEVLLEVHQALLANCEPSKVKRIHSKPEAFSQCRKWLAIQYPKAELVPAPSTSRAVQIARAENLLEPDAGAAAIGSELAGELHDLAVLFPRIEDDPNNVTRFFVVAKTPAERSGDDKTSIMFTTNDRPGALVDVLLVFKDADINLTHIDKRPSGRTNWSYTFFIDAIGHRDDPHVAHAIETSRALCSDLHVLGSYPRARRVL